MRSTPENIASVARSLAFNIMKLGSNRSSEDSTRLRSLLGDSFGEADPTRRERKKL